MRGALGGPRVLLRRLREVMAEPVSAQERLDKIVVLIAANMVAEVCSVYVLRVDGSLELYATEGLKREAVHLTVLNANEGLVGLVAREAKSVNLSEAHEHPAFSYRPETGEEIYHSFLGVPILRAGNTLGVLVVQNRAKRTYVEEEVEALQTTAMVLAEMIASGELSALAQPGAEPAARHSLHKTGAILSDGIALGHVVLHEPRVVITNYIAEDLPKEIKRLDTGLTLTACWSAATSPRAASTATCWKPIACSPTITAGRTSCTKRSPPASPPRLPSSACNPTRVRACCVPPIPICATACTTSKTSVID
jgi:phosphotransferase system enzyme I (PtsP)